MSGKRHCLALEDEEQIKDSKSFMLFPAKQNRSAAMGFVGAGHGL